MIDIAGEPGIGKSRLLHEFRQRIGKSGAFILLGGARRRIDKRRFYLSSSWSAARFAWPPARTKRQSRASSTMA